METPAPDKPNLTFVCRGVEGMIFTDGERFFLVWESKTTDYDWVGMEVKSPMDAFLSVGYPNWCGAEIDMRQSDEDPMTDEIKELGDRMAEALNQHYKDTEKRATADFEALEKQKAKTK